MKRKCTGRRLAYAKDKSIHIIELDPRMFP
jgi:hypothetical protein